MKICFIIAVFSCNILSYANDLTQIINDSTEIPEVAKIGLDTLGFWSELREKYPDTTVIVPELTDEAAKITAGAKEQIARYYSLADADSLTKKIIQVYDKYKITPYTLMKFYEFISELCCAASLSYESSYNETLDICKKLLDSGYIVAPIFPTTGTEDFDGKIGYAAIVVGLTQKIWLAGLSFKPKMSVSDYYITKPDYSSRLYAPTTLATPSLFWWYEVSADAFIFILQQKLMQENTNLDTIKTKLAESPTSETFQLYFARFRRNNIGGIPFNLQ